MQNETKVQTPNTAWEISKFMKYLRRKRPENWSMTSSFTTTRQGTPRFWSASIFPEKKCSCLNVRI